ncbi:MAG: class I SAM-dependent methyltransferase [Burkholderiales bacterium]|nr:class I SAM-dependent methyltransferase [Burkholderiales bacterium]
MHTRLAPSPWIQRWAHLLPARARVLDLACGSGRHVLWLAERGHALTAVDRDAEALTPLRAHAECIVADLEAAPWPLGERQFDGLVVTNYLWRPLWPRLRAALAPDGVLLYETFARGNETVGRPARADFLLEPGELLQACEGLRIVAYEHGFLPAPERFVQRVAAVRLADESAGPARHALG